LYKARLETKDLGSAGANSQANRVMASRYPGSQPLAGLRKEFMMYDRARRRYYASRFSLFVSYGVNSTATMPGPASVRSLAKKRGPVYGFVAHWSWMLCAAALGIIPGETYRKPQAASYKLAV